MTGLRYTNIGHVSASYFRYFLKCWVAWLTRGSYPSKKELLLIERKNAGVSALGWIGLIRALGGNAGSRTGQKPSSAMQPIADLQGTLALFQDWANCLTRMNSVNSLNSPVCHVLLLSPLYGPGNWVFGKLCNIPEITWLLSGRTRTQIQLMREAEL